MKDLPPLPETVGVIDLPGAILFPNALLPLYIFEPRYRDMLAQALSDDRVFAVAMRRDDAVDEVHDVGGAGLVRACIRNADGTSHLILQGVSRVRFTEWLQIHPFRIARIEPLASKNRRAPEAAELAERVRSFCEELAEHGYNLPRDFDSFLESAESPEALSDAVCATLVPDPDVRQQLLQELDVARRLKDLLSCLKAQIDAE